MAEVATIEDSGKGRRKAVVKAAPPADAEGATILGMIDRLIAKPDVPVEKLERLFDLHQRVQADHSRRAYFADLAVMQPKLPVIDKKGTIKTNEKDKQGNKTGNQIKQSKYALWEDVVEQIRPVLAEFGFSLFFKVDQPTPDRALITTTLAHAGGHSESTGISLPIDTSGSKNNVQGWGSTVSYGKRYGAFALLNVVARGEDDDGTAGGADLISDDQANALLRLIADTKSDPQQFLAIAKVESISDISAAKFGVLEAMLEAKQKKQRAPV